MVDRKSPQIGILALQGDFQEHLEVLTHLEVEARTVRQRGDLDELDGLIIPGGESTVIADLMHSTGIDAGILEHTKRGMAVWGTCAGLILMSSETDTDSVPTLGLMDITVARNWFGRQINSFEADLSVLGMEEQPFRAVFIRAPIVTRVGSGVTTLAELADGGVVAVRQGRLLGTAFHPELTTDTRFHQLFVEMAQVKPMECAV